MKQPIIIYRYSSPLSDSLYSLRTMGASAIACGDSVPIASSFVHRCDGSDRLIKFAQHLLNKLPRRYLPVAQQLLEELLTTDSEYNKLDGAPDPTAGGRLGEAAVWSLKEQALRDNIRKILFKFCLPSPTVYSDVNYLSSTQPPAAMEWQALLRPLRGREPEGLWNLLCIVREMYRRKDENCTKLLHLITNESIMVGLGLCTAHFLFVLLLRVGGEYYIALN